MTVRNNSLDQRTFDKLKRLYIIALSAIALSIITSQLLIRKYLDDQENDSRVINVAGRQRMLSQKLTKLTLLIAETENAQIRQHLKEQLAETQQLWRSSHEALQNGSNKLNLPGDNSEIIAGMFEKIASYFNTMLNASEQIISKLENNPLTDIAELQSEIEAIKQNEVHFLETMDSIVNQFDVEAKEKVDRLRNVEMLIMCITLAILLGEFLLIFWPTAKAVKNSIHDLLEAEKNAKKMAYDADILSQAKEKSVRQLRALNQAMDQTFLFARVSTDGSIVYVGDKFSRLFKVRKLDAIHKFSEILSIYRKEQTAIEEIIGQYKKIGWQGEVKATTKEKEAVWLEMSIIPFTTEEDKPELIIICMDITERKNAQLEIDRLTQESFEEKMNQQSIISKKIIENQENEQNRIAKDIHDGIGQMLTGLKFELESLNLNDLEKASAKIENLKKLSANIIKGVRTATFNLTPPELTDHGITPALAKLTHELSRLTSKEIVLYNKTDFNQRLDSLTEINIYRITQEAINNAIKYAQSSHIIVTVSHSKQILSVTIDDNGKGFDPEKVKNVKNGDGGMGLTFMKERIKYINGRFFLNSILGKGTRITLNIPIQEYEKVRNNS
ncbi:ATP-binding protein [Chondrinema litorale]|uniref:sensor histidine kinase n=1 Tax=Chondrinema litorale TaxID=2994555 RepID=UPI0025429822|nr:ATP-binding protein [Chondrinema litorale]UZR99519.1 type IV pili methyl-accepting chemotaxis transducer N-terminal domain-containing protein [Chondrinema litorale]